MNMSICFCSLSTLNISIDFCRSLNGESPALIFLYAHNLPLIEPTHIHKFLNYSFTYNKRKKCLILDFKLLVGEYWRLNTIQIEKKTVKPDTNLA